MMSKEKIFSLIAFHCREEGLERFWIGQVVLAATSGALTIMAHQTKSVASPT